MTNFEKIDDYLAQRLSAEERTRFEEALAGDASLRKEVAFQEKVIQSVRQARAAELKHMLQQVPVPTGGGWSPAQVTASIIATGIVATGLYFYFRPDTAPLPVPPATPEVTVEPTPAKPAEEQPDATTAPAEEPKKKPAATKATDKVTPVQKPDIQVTDPTAEFTETKEPSEPASATTPRTELTVSKLQVVTVAGDKKYSFHYQFAEGKLHLFGPFDNNLYEILEINGDSHAVFLFYKENYYLLDEEQTVISPLPVIRDGPLLKKLREYRKR